jgi:hypothetical protein
MKIMASDRHSREGAFETIIEIYIDHRTSRPDSTLLPLQPVRPLQVRSAAFDDFAMNDGGRSMLNTTQQQ